MAFFDQKIIFHFKKKCDVIKENRYQILNQRKKLDVIKYCQKIFETCANQAHYFECQYNFAKNIYVK